MAKQKPTGSRLSKPAAMAKAAVVGLLAVGWLAGCGGPSQDKPAPGVKQTPRATEARKTATISPKDEVDLALSAKVTASSEFTDYGNFRADRAIDGGPGEWASKGEQAGAWIELRWSAPVMVRRVVLEDRPLEIEHVRAGHLEFFDGGTTVAVETLPNTGDPLEVTFEPRQVTRLRFVIDRVGPRTVNTGLRELRVFGVKKDS